MSETNPPQVQGLRRLLCLVMASISFGFGVLGIVLPGLPTTPFLLLTSYLLVRSYPALNDRMLRARGVGPILRDWQNHRGVRPHIKTRVIVVITGMVAATSLWGNLAPGLMLLVLALSAIGVAVVARLPTVSGRTEEARIERRFGKPALDYEFLGD